jgi:hypothetical protein
MADVAGIRPRCHRTDSVGEIRRTHPSKVGAGLVHGGIGKIVIGTVDGAKVDVAGRRARVMAASSVMEK